MFQTSGNDKVHSCKDLLTGNFLFINMEIFQQMQIQQSVFNESEGQIHMGQAPGVLLGEARQGIVPAVGDDIIFHGIHAPYFSSFCHYSSAQ